VSGNIPGAGPIPWGDLAFPSVTGALRHFEKVLEQISAAPFVVRTKSVLVLSPLLRRPAHPHAP
jgi:hypothetical protein